MEIKEIEQKNGNILPIPPGAICLLLTGLVPEARGHFRFFLQKRFINFCLNKKTQPIITFIEPVGGEKMLLLFPKKIMVPLKAKGSDAFINPWVDKDRIERMIFAAHKSAVANYEKLKKSEGFSKKKLENSKKQILSYKQKPIIQS